MLTLQITWIMVSIAMLTFTSKIPCLVICCTTCCPSQRSISSCQRAIVKGSKEVLWLSSWEPLTPGPCGQCLISCLPDPQPNPHPLTWLSGLALDLSHHHGLPKGPSDRDWSWTLPPDMILPLASCWHLSLPSLEGWPATTAPKTPFHFPPLPSKLSLS